MIIIYSTFILLRIFFPITIFYIPLIAIISSLLLDTFDAEFASRSSICHSKYEIIDKILDFWWYFWILIFSLVYFKGFIFLLFILFIYRAIGTVLFLRTKKRYLLFIFPNLFENVFLLLFATRYYHWVKFITQDNILYFIIGISLLKLIQEFWLHIAKISIRKDIFKIKTHWRSEMDTP